MNSLQSPDDDSLEALLKSPRHPIPDDGFSMRVVAALPAAAQAKPAPSGYRALVLFTGFSAGLGVAFVKNRQPVSALFRNSSSLFANAMAGLPAIDTSVMLTAVAVLAGSLCLAFRRDIVRAFEKF